jgi:hypothetical protein
MDENSGARQSFVYIPSWTSDSENLLRSNIADPIIMAGRGAGVGSIFT